MRDGGGGRGKEMRRPEIPKVLIFSQGSLPLILLLPHPQPPKHTLTRPSWFMAQLLTKGEEGAATVWADLRAKLSSPPPWRRRRRGGEIGDRVSTALVWEEEEDRRGSRIRARGYYWGCSLAVMAERK